jgi:hypothetical protein
MNIPANQARSTFTKARVAAYKEMPRPTEFLRSFFKPVEKTTRYLSIEVERGTEKVAVDVIRGGEGNMNQFGRSTEKVIDPPFYHEKFNATELDLYDRLFTESGDISDSQLADFVTGINEKLSGLQNKVERAYEVMAAQVFKTGVVQLESGDNIDFRRKAGSMVDLGAGNYWATATVDPMTALENGCNFLRSVGKAQGGVYNAILGSTAMRDLQNNPVFQAKANLRRVLLVDMPQLVRESTGGVLHGRITVGSYEVNLWTYPEEYTDADGNQQPYVNPKDVVMIPENPRFTHGFAAVPQLLTKEGGASNGITLKRGAYIFNDWIDTGKTAHYFDVKSAGITIPTAVDQIYTFQAVA